MKKILLLWIFSVILTISMTLIISGYFDPYFDKEPQLRIVAPPGYELSFGYMDYEGGWINRKPALFHPSPWWSVLREYGPVLFPVNGKDTGIFKEDVIFIRKKR